MFSGKFFSMLFFTQTSFIWTHQLWVPHYWMHSRGKVAKELGQTLLHLKLEKHTLVLEKKLVISPHLTTICRRCVGSYMGSYFPATVNFILIKSIKMKFGGLAKPLALRNLYPLLFSHKEQFDFLPRGYNQKSIQSLHSYQNPGSRSNVQTFPLNLEMAPYGVAT